MLCCACLPRLPLGRSCHSFCRQFVQDMQETMSQCSNVKRCLPPWAVAGLICTNCQPHQVVTDAIYDARSICLREYGDAPEVDVYGDPGFAFAYVPSHLHHMVSDCRARPRFDRKLRLLDLGYLMCLKERNEQD